MSPHSISPALRRPATTAPATARSTRALAAAIDRDGIAAHEDAVARLADATRARDRAPTLAGVLLDRGAPAVARERAFGRIDWAALAAAHAPGARADRRATAA